MRQQVKTTRSMCGRDVPAAIAIEELRKQIEHFCGLGSAEIDPATSPSAGSQAGPKTHRTAEIAYDANAYGAIKASPYTIRYIRYSSPRSLAEVRQSLGRTNCGRDCLVPMLCGCGYPSLDWQADTV